MSVRSFFSLLFILFSSLILDLDFSYGSESSFFGWPNASKLLLLNTNASSDKLHTNNFSRFLNQREVDGSLKSLKKDSSVS